MYPNPEASDLLKRMLTFNPNRRASIEECLNHPFLKDVREKSKNIEIKRKKKIRLNFDGKVPTMEELRELFKEEIKRYA